ncbi:MAG: dTDP-4-dehydrorhamnose 3,5-epimerase [Chitinophagaceae bacterium]|nr:dTDP-4-dehydrorhamnose 3,5-epimerase [Chitinophagaceae bacterium]
MIFSPTPLQGSYIIQPQRFSDERGWFARTFCGDEFRQIGHEDQWVQMNHSYTAKKGTIRGMHFQHPPFREIKLVRCTRGKVFDVIIDIRKNSTTFLKWFGTELSAETMNMLYIPGGFAHGFQCLTDDCELVYLHSEFYRPGHEGGIRYDDKLVNIQWPEEVAVISKRDESHPPLTENFKGI